MTFGSHKSTILIQTLPNIHELRSWSLKKRNDPEEFFQEHSPYAVSETSDHTESRLFLDLALSEDSAQPFEKRTFWKIKKKTEKIRRR